MIWWIGAAIFYVTVLAAICIFFKGASIFDKSLEENEKRRLPPSGNRTPSNSQSHPPRKTPNIIFILS